MSTLKILHRAAAKRLLPAPEPVPCIISDLARRPSIQQFYNGISTPEFYNIDGRGVLLNPEDIFKGDAHEMTQNYSVDTAMSYNSNMICRTLRRILAHYDV